MIDVARIDYWAATGRSPFHRASVVSKALFVLAVVAAAGLARSPEVLAGAYGVLLATAAATRLPWTRVGLLSLYPAFFALLYGISMEGGMQDRVMLVLKAVTPACAILILIVSTPYPRIFALVGRMLPEVVAAGLFMTYRTFFILLDMMGHFLIALRLRGGLGRRRILQAIVNVPRGIAMVLVAAVERAERLYTVMTVRGYRGSMADAVTGGLQRADWFPVVVGGSVLALVLVWR